ncbi:MAG: hypothetical protein LN575_06110 [Rickettsia endosymbiont of Gnoriste bilineata]|nr:hypothetical protein [Rickettsia endosymbiont of Gnoriste bilineata]
MKTYTAEDHHNDHSDAEDGRTVELEEKVNLDLEESLDACQPPLAEEIAHQYHPSNFKAYATNARQVQKRFDVTHGKAVWNDGGQFVTTNTTIIFASDIAVLISSPSHSERLDSLFLKTVCFLNAIYDVY